MKFNSDHWALIIGASGGIGLAAAEKLAAHGLNLILIHRDRRGAMAAVTPAFEKLKDHGIRAVSMNMDALSSENRTHILDTVKDFLGRDGKIRLLLHALALGNLKLLAPTSGHNATDPFEKLAGKLGCPPDKVRQAVQDVFNAGENRLYPCVETTYDESSLLDHDDFKHTIHAMGVNIAEWVQDVFARGYFADDARVLTLTSEGNQVAWRGYAAVSAAKAVLESLSRSMAVEFGPYGIRSNVIQAGVTDTAALRMIPGNETIKAHARHRNPLGRLTTPCDVANVICLLCSDEAAWINGALICVDGGERIG